MPGGDGSAPLTFNMPLTYLDGVYRFLDSNGNLAEVHIEWCQLLINADGLKLSIVLPVGFAALGPYWLWLRDTSNGQRNERISGDSTQSVKSGGGY